MLSTVVRRLPTCSRGIVAAVGQARKLSAAAATGSSPTALQPINTDGMFSELDDNTIRSQLSKMHEAEAELIAKLNTPPVTIDWDLLKSEIQDPTLVDEVKTMLENEPVPDVEGDVAKMTAEVESAFAPIIAECEEMVAESQAETLELERRLADFTFLRDNLEELSAEDFLKRYPGMKESLEEDIKNNKWFIEE